MDKLLSIWNFIRRHKYSITTLVFAIIIGFLDENSMVRRIGYAREINRLQEEINGYRSEYEESTKRLNELTTKPEAIEKIAREKYLMKKPNEDIYVFEEEEDKK
ncbi:MAG: putative septum formation initiator-related protein [Bacteroidetes bacterium]|jgi:cell division protein DivIC|nr:putative septum formation initiator-related protein [Bacteroidota bacterium]